MIDVLSYTHPTGYSFSPNERVALATSLPLLLTQTKRRYMRVWGKIFGYKADYILVQAFDDDRVAEPELFYSIDEGLTFTLLGTTSSMLRSLPDISDNPLEQQQYKLLLLRELRGTYMGDPAYEYRIADEGDENDAIATRSYKESVRVALFVEEHDYHCRIAPRGAFYRCERQESFAPEVRPSAAFEGLSRTLEGALSLKNYYHIRAANPYRHLLADLKGELSVKSDLERLIEYPSIDAIFDSVADDIPTGLWNMQYDPLHDLVVGRSTRFVGSIFFHVPETNKYGSVYMGDGVINQNFAFEI